MTPLMMAGGYRYTDIVDVLLDRGADARRVPGLRFIGRSRILRGIHDW